MPNLFRSASLEVSHRYALVAILWLVGAVMVQEGKGLICSHLIELTMGVEIFWKHKEMTVTIDYI
jgi:hypothetical protein